MAAFTFAQRIQIIEDNWGYQWDKILKKKVVK